ncbi:hypothetical protein Hanom_Chr04g00314141 [Helianthus anomalus]
MVYVFLDIKWTSPEGNFNVADFPSFVISFATAPATLANCPLFPSVISMLYMVVSKGISVEVDSSFLSIKTPSQTVQASSKAYDIGIKICRITHVMIFPFHHLLDLQNTILIKLGHSKPKFT